jgi:hypothetical protein
VIYAVGDEPEKHTALGPKILAQESFTEKSTRTLRFCSSLVIETEVASVCRAEQEAQMR